MYYFLTSSYLLQLTLVAVTINPFFFLWRYSLNLGLGLPPWNSPFHFGFLDLSQSIGLLGWVISSSQGLYLYKNTEKRTHTKTLNIHALSGFEPTIPASERAKTVRALDRSATVTGTINPYMVTIIEMRFYKQY
jgi:hypothetical protein